MRKIDDIRANAELAGVGRRDGILIETQIFLNRARNQDE